MKVDIFVVSRSSESLTKLDAHLNKKNNISYKIFHDAESALSFLSVIPDIVIIDEVLIPENPDGFSGLDLMVKFKQKNIDSAVVILTNNLPPAKVFNYISKGAFYCLDKSQPEFFEELDKCLYKINFLREFKKGSISKV